MKDPDTKNSKGSIARNSQNFENSTEDVDQCMTEENFKL